MKPNRITSYEENHKQRALAVDTTSQAAIDWHGRTMTRKDEGILRIMPIGVNTLAL